MSQVFQEAVRELKLDPARPVRVWADGLVIELRVIRSETGGTVVSPWALQKRPSDTVVGFERVGRLMASARVLTSSRWGGRA